MQFIFHKDASNSRLTLDGELFNYIIKARRSAIDDEIGFRNLTDDNLYTYKIDCINKKNCELTLVANEHLPKKPKKFLHILWCIIDPKTVEKELPFLNQIGVSKISFVGCDYSQRNFKPNFERLNSILINSCGQCGRSDLMQLNTITKDELKSLDFAILDFCDSKISKDIFEFDTFLIGPEGGFSQKERDFFVQKKKFGFDLDFILKSENAVSAISTIYLLS